MRVLCVCDVFGSVGRRVLAHRLVSLRKERNIDVCIANGENAAGGIGITDNVRGKLLKYGVDIITGGNHSFAHIGTEPELYTREFLLRPHNMPPGNPGTGVCSLRLDDGRVISVLNLQGRTFFREVYDCPFRCASAAIERLRSSAAIIVDFHAEATSEKVALGWHLDGRVSAVLGTHTHVQTADERVLEQGTAYITDLGMTGPEDSVIGMKREVVVKRFLTQSRLKMEPADAGAMLNAAIIDVDDRTGLARSIERVFERVAV
jgi:2',3'-cyclic-nucleotide 2'-phosphodiesterase